MTSELWEQNNVQSCDKNCHGKKLCPKNSIDGKLHNKTLSRKVIGNWNWFNYQLLWKKVINYHYQLLTKESNYFNYQLLFK